MLCLFSLGVIHNFISWPVLCSSIELKQLCLLNMETNNFVYWSGVGTWGGTFAKNNCLQGRVFDQFFQMPGVSRRFARGRDARGWNWLAHNRPLKPSFHMIAHDRRIAENVPAIVSYYMETLFSDRAISEIEKVLSQRSWETVSDRQWLYETHFSDRAIEIYPTMHLLAYYSIYAISKHCPLLCYIAIVLERLEYSTAHGSKSKILKP